MRAGARVRAAIAAGQGYTLIEILISIGIMVILMSIVVGTYSLGRDYERLKGETAKLASVIREARNRDFNGVTDRNGGGTLIYPSGGYGVHMVKRAVDERDYYVLFANHLLDADLPFYDDSDNTSTNNEFIQKIDLPDKIRFELPDSASAAEILFQNGTFAVYTKVGSSWAVYDSPDTGPVKTHTIKLAGCPDTRSKGVLTLTKPGDFAAWSLTDSLESC